MLVLQGQEWLQSAQKRRFDVACAIGSLPLVGPVTAAGLALAAGQHGGRPVFYQQRIGKAGEPFTIYKLRTMPHGTPETKSDGHYDHRATQIGRALRILRIDETPQLLNVLRGEMSIVGPRPLVPVHIEQILDELPTHIQQPWLRARQSCRPGMFDPYAVSTYVHDAEDSALARAEADIAYATEASARHDIATIIAAAGFYKHMVELQRVKSTAA